ncbi:hypothetical protein K6L44_02630 [Gluconacetobacter entanii]|uniref:hypothetical protein n=1 Tax=Gluconacetobacter entanii TaxID=108528 RepID=UPI001C931CAB|nr:hypothetical protein [Gluconacetobacter entanii]MBY4638914.1 hypothetical protein [Gluconacetobacter entanii]MCW4579586.1 hypothetical protein [Gluconacetobacter entanii]MCW4582992.1 hypothetical protein [Gluconacetobacter entanii]MCW4586378.1 hypothetical protein [Gluconacetobacter entanii]
MLLILSVLVGIYSIHLIDTGSHVTGGLLLITDILCIMWGIPVARSDPRTQAQADDTQDQVPAPHQDAERPGPHEIPLVTPHMTADACERQEIESSLATDTPPAGSTASAMKMLRTLVDDVATGKGTRPPPSVYDRAAEAGTMTVHNVLARIAQDGGNVEEARSHAENIFCSGFNQYLDEENVDSQSQESRAEMELAVMAWKSRNP